MSHKWHVFFTEKPLDFRGWVERYLGTIRYWALQGRFHQIDIKYTATDRREISAHYRQEFERLCDLRNDGARGRLELAAFD